jgi:probable rRNA maturation factor
MSARRSFGRPEISVIIEENAWRGAVPDLPAKIKQGARTALSHATSPRAPKLTILLTGDEHVQVLNKQYRGKDRPTNVLSFPSGHADYLGDIAIAYGTTAREAEASGKPLAKHAIHLAVHGVLHLLGYDHEKPRDAETMEALETEILADMGIPDPYRPPARSATRR